MSLKNDTKKVKKKKEKLNYETSWDEKSQLWESQTEQLFFFLNYQSLFPTIKHNAGVLLWTEDKTNKETKKQLNI